MVSEVVLVANAHIAEPDAAALLVSRLLGAEVVNSRRPSQDDASSLDPSHGFRSLHERMLVSAGTTWSDLAPVHPSWFRSAAADAFMIPILNRLSTEFGDSRAIVVADPLMCRLLPFWREVCDRKQMAAKAIVSFGSPQGVAAALRRGGLSERRAVLVWLRNALEAEAHTRAMPRIIFFGEEVFADWRGAAARIGEALGFEWLRRSAAVEADIDAAISRTERWAGDAVDAVEPSWVAEAQALLRTIARGGPDTVAACKRLDETRVAFDEACDRLGVVVADADADARRERDRAKRAEADVARLEQIAASGTDERLSPALVRIEELETELYDIRRSLSDRFAELAALDHENRELWIRVNTMDRLRAQLQAAEARATTLEERAAVLSEGLEDRRRKVATLRSKLDSERQKAVALRSQVEESRAKEQTLRSTLEGQRQNAAKLRSKLEEERSRRFTRRASRLLNQLRLPLGK